MSEQAKHTPGPWEVRHRLDSIGNPMGNGRFVVLQTGSSLREDFYICECPFAAVRSRDAEEQDANARLIAAAPYLLDAGVAGLEAIDTVLSSHEDQTEYAQLRAAFEALESAIAKAEGRS